MSHFPVAVFCHTDTDAELTGQLAPYQENNMDDCPKKYLEFQSIEQEGREKYETATVIVVKAPDGHLLWPCDKIFRVESIGEDGIRHAVYRIPEGAGYEEITTKFSELYPTFERFMEDYEGFEKDPEKGEYGYWENPNARWDWWQIGGRYSNWFKKKLGGYADWGQIGELDFTLDQKQYQHALRFWEINIEGAPLQPGENKNDFLLYYSPNYIQAEYGTKEAYATSEADYTPWGFIDFEGVWHEKGKMGWFAASDATKDSRVAFHEAFHKALQDAAPTDYIVLVDCHI